MTDPHPPWDGISTRRDISPDGRLRLEILPWPDPRSQFELETPWGGDLYEVATGERIGTFGTFRHEWPPEGGVVLNFPHNVLKIAPDLQTFTSLADGPHVFPIGELAAWQARGGEVPLSAYPDPPPPRPPGWVGWLLGGGTLLLGTVALLVVVFGLWFGFPAAERPASHQITGWNVDCPGLGWTIIHLGQDGRLEVPRAIAPAPLPPVAGGAGEARRFGDARAQVEVDGTDVTWWPAGPAGRAIACRSRVAG